MTARNSSPPSTSAIFAAATSHLHRGKGRAMSPHDQYDFGDELTEEEQEQFNQLTDEQRKMFMPDNPAHLVKGDLANRRAEAETKAATVEPNPPRQSSARPNPNRRRHPKSAQRGSPASQRA